jgi:Flp pilus assembly protein TadB
MHTVTSLHGSTVRPEQLKALTADYLALEQAREFRRLLVTRCGFVVVAIAAAGPGLGWLPPFASWFLGGLFLAVAGCAWLVELRRERRLEHRLKDVPGAAVQVVRR